MGRPRVKGDHNKAMFISNPVGMRGSFQSSDRDRVYSCRGGAEAWIDEGEEQREGRQTHMRDGGI